MKNSFISQKIIKFLNLNQISSSHTRINSISTFFAYIISINSQFVYHLCSWEDRNLKLKSILQFPCWWLYLSFFFWIRYFLSTFNFVCSFTRLRYRVASIIFYSKYPSNVSKQQNFVRDSSGFESAIKIWSKTIVCKRKKNHWMSNKQNLESNNKILLFKSKKCSRARLENTSQTTKTILGLLLHHLL